MDMHKDLKAKDAYFSYMLRIWRLRKSETRSTLKENIWRVSLESTQTREQFMFASLEEMILFLQEHFTQVDEASDEE